MIPHLLSALVCFEKSNSTRITNTIIQSIAKSIVTMTSSLFWYQDRIKTLIYSSTKQHIIFIFICDTFTNIISSKFPWRQHELTSFAINETWINPTILPLSFVSFFHKNAETTFFIRVRFICWLLWMLFVTSNFVVF